MVGRSLTSEENLRSYEKDLDFAKAHDLVGVTAAALASAGIYLASVAADMKQIPLQDYLLHMQEEGPRMARERGRVKQSEMILTGTALISGGYHCGMGSINHEDYQVLVNAYAEGMETHDLINSVVAVCGSMILSLNMAHEDAPTLGDHVYAQFRRDARAAAGGESLGCSANATH